MKAVALAALCAQGCATAWVSSQIAGTQRMWDEHERDVAVPEPGLTESLTVSLPLFVELGDPPTPGGVPPVKPFGLTCSLDQDGHQLRYRAAFRYGSTWKKETAVFFLLEAATAAAVLLAGSGVEDDGFGGVLALDAVGTAALFFAPRKDVFHIDEETNHTHVRSDCPAGISLVVGEQTFAVDPVGNIGNPGFAAVDAWMASPAGAIAIDYGGRRQELQVGNGERCNWLHAHESAQCPTTRLGSVRVAFDLAPGALTQ